MDRIGVIRLSSLGDIILAEPITACFRDNFPSAKIVFLTRESYRPLVEMFSAVDKCICFEIPGKHQKLRDLRFELRQIPDGFDILVDLHKNIRSKVIMRSLSATKKISYNKKRIGRQLAVWFRKRSDSIHTIDKYFAPLFSLGLNVTHKIPDFRIDEKFVQEAKEYLSARGFADGTFVVLAVGGSHPAKHYPIRQYAQLARLIYESYGLKILVVEKEQVAHLNLFDGLLSEGCFEYAIGLDLRLLAAVIKSSKAAISNDSGIMHLSAAVGIPTAGLFGPTHPVLGFSPLGKKCMAITTNESCAPCSLHGERLCYRDEQYCFTKMTPELILSRLDQYLR